MLTQPFITQLSGGNWLPIAPNLWPLATQASLASSLVSQMAALGIADAKVVDMTGYADAAGNFHNDIYGMYQYYEPATRFYGIIGTLKADGQPDVPIYEPAGQLWDRQTKPNAFFDKIAPIVIGGNQEPFPNGAKLKIESHPEEGYATLYWSWQ